MKINYKAKRLNRCEFIKVLNKHGFKGKFEALKTIKNKKLGIFLNKNCKEYFEELFLNWVNKDSENQD